MTIYLSASDIAQMHESGLVGITDYIAAVEAAYRDQGLERFQILPRQNFYVERPGEKRPGSLKVGGGMLGGVGVMGTSMYATGYGEMNLWAIAFSTRTGEVEGIVHGRLVGRMKTGATAAVAASHMAREDARIVGLIGSGDQAETQLMGLAAVRPIAEARVYSRTPERRKAFEAWAAKAVPSVRTRAAASAREAVEGADIVVTVTNSKEPVLDAAWIAAGAHCNFIGAHYPKQREVDAAVLKRGRIVVDDLDQAWNEKGELLMPLEAGEIDRDIVLGDLGSVIAGRVKPRRNQDDITIFLSGGTALEYMGASSMLIRKATAAGLGLALPE
jgi:ornithine cyclodeaminase/alanine dehydrogenase-like protein (mu-crystallin family)